MTVRPPLVIEQVKIRQLGSDRTPLRNFCCGEDQVDGWAAKCHKLEEQHRARAFCAHMVGCDSAYGFYSISLRGQPAKGLGDTILRGHNDGGYVPFVYIDFLGVQKEFQRRGLGTILLIDALRRCHTVALNAGFFGVALHSLNEDTTRLYKIAGLKSGILILEIAPH